MFGKGGLGNLMKQAQQMQEKMQKNNWLNDYIFLQNFE